MHFRLIIMIFILSYAPCLGQNPVIQVGKNKNTYVIISGTVADRPDIAGQDSAISFARLPNLPDQAKEMNLFKLKANRENFQETNMLINCVDTIFEFTIVYSANPQTTRYPFRYVGSAGSGIAAADPLQMISNGALSVPAANLRKLRESKRNITKSATANNLVIMLDNIGISNGYHYFKLRIRNKSAIPFEVDYLKFVIESKGKRRFGSKVGVIEQSSYPTYIEAPGNPSIVAPGGEQELIYALAQLPLTAEEEQLTIIMQEKALNSKGRSLALTVQAAIFNNRRKIIVM